MRRRKEPLLLILVLLAGGAMFQWLSLRTWGQDSANQKTEAVDHIPLLDYDLAKSNRDKSIDEQTRAHRHAVGNRYNKQYLVKRNANTGGRPVLTLSEWNEILPALPIVLSDTVVLGEIISGEADLSNDYTGVYSEFTVRVEEIFKNNESAPISPGALITTERQGGRVRVPSGQIIRYGIAGQDMPRQGQRYLLFLKANEEQFWLVTGYQLVADRVVPLDGENAPGPVPMRWAGDAFNGADANHLLDEVKKAIAQASQPTNP